jgi:hypothetical protein
MGAETQLRLRSSTGRSRRAPRLNLTAKLLAIIPVLEAEKLEQTVADSLARQLDISSRSIYRWRSAVRSFLISALRNRGRSDKGSSRRIRGQVAAYLLCATESKPRKSVSEVHRALVRDWPQFGIQRRAPSYQSVRRFVKKVRP